MDCFQKNQNMNKVTRKVIYKGKLRKPNIGNDDIININERLWKQLKLSLLIRDMENVMSKL